MAEDAVENGVAEDDAEAEAVQVHRDASADEVQDEVPDLPVQASGGDPRAVLKISLSDA